MHISSRGPRSYWRCGSLNRTKRKEPETSVLFQGLCHFARAFGKLSGAPATCVASRLVDKIGCFKLNKR